MSNLENLGVEKGLEILDELHATLGRFREEEAALVRRIRERKVSLQRAAWADREATERLLAERTQQIESDYQAERERLTEIHDRRRARIQEVSNTGRRTLAKRAQDHREAWLGDLQMRHFLIERRLQAEQDAADGAQKDALTKLREERSRLQTLERQARDSFTGYMSFLRKLREKSATPAAGGEPDALLEKLHATLDSVERQLAEFRSYLLVRILSYAPALVVLPLIVLLVFLVGYLRGEWVVTGTAGGSIAAAFLVLHGIGKRQSKRLASDVVDGLAEARAFADASLAAVNGRHATVLEKIEAQRSELSAEIEGKWERADVVRSEFEARERERFSRRTPRALAKNEALLAARIARLDSEHERQLARARADFDEARTRNEQTLSSGGETVAGEEAAAWRDLEQRWSSAIDPIFAEIERRNHQVAATFPDWTPDYVGNWTPSLEFLPATRFARLDVNIPPGPGTEGSRLALPSSEPLSIPLALTYPNLGSVLFETDEPLDPAVTSCLNQIILRLLATTPPGKVGFTILDPVGLGQNFAGLMHLGDFEESLITRRIWTQPDQIEERLAELSQHIEKVIQMYLRDEYATIAEYNARAGSTAEKYHFLVIADFPANFSETAIKRLQSILTSGPRCGVHTLIHWDRRQPLPSGIFENELRANSVCIQGGRNGLALETSHSTFNARLTLDMAPPPELALKFIEKVGASSIDSNQVQVPFEQITPEPAERWTFDTTHELRVPIGRSGATKQQVLAIGKGTRQHALIAGKTGSGKSTLFHVIITNLALHCSPEQVEFYLIDFKKGVEFKCYATKQLPHARVVAIESDREFGLSVLQRVDDELRRRGDLFRKLGAQDVAGYKRAGGDQPIPRTLLMIDEFQEFFVEDDAIAQSASVLLDRIVRQGRAFGIHVILGSQTLGGAYSLARATLGQMVIRIALQCNEADAYLIMDDNNAAPRLLSRPGEGIYNDEAGAVEGNSPFQVCWLSEEERDQYLDQVRDLARQHPELDATPIVFEGNAPADIAENALLAKALDSRSSQPPISARVWLGAPNSIKGPTEAVFHRQSGSNLLIVGQRDDAALTMLAASLIALAAQYPPGTARFLFAHQSTPGSADANLIQQTLSACAHDVTPVSSQNVAEVIHDLASELKHRTEGSGGETETFLLIHGLHRFRKLRAEDEFDFSIADPDAAPKPGAEFAELIHEGSAHGIHILASIDTLNSVNRFLNRKALSEFEMRVVFQMSANDSASLIDSPKAGNLGLHRALFHNEQAGTLETFRPYATPDPAWFERIATPAVSN